MGNRPYAAGRRYRAISVAFRNDELELGDRRPDTLAGIQRSVQAGGVGRLLYVADRSVRRTSISPSARSPLFANAGPSLRAAGSKVARPRIPEEAENDFPPSAVCRENVIDPVSALQGVTRKRFVPALTGSYITGRM